MSDPILGLPIWKRQQTPPVHGYVDCTEPRVGRRCCLAGAPGESGWPRYCPHIPWSCSGTTPRRGQVSLLSTLGPEFSTLRPQVQKKTLLPWTPSPLGEGRWLGFLFVPFQSPPSTPFWILPSAFSTHSTLNLNISLKPKTWRQQGNP